MKTVFTIACEIPGGLGVYVPFRSRASLLDADFVVFEPDIEEYESRELYRGKRLLNDVASFRIQEDIEHWRRELTEILTAGRTVFMRMKSRDDVYVSTGEKQYSGTGRNRHTTNMVRLLSNYDVLPISEKIIESNGASMVLCPGEQILREYWEHFGGDSRYQVHMAESETAKSLVVARHGKRVVGAIIRTQGGGTLVALPWIDFLRDEFFTDAPDEDDGDVEAGEAGALDWTPKAKDWGSRYFECLVSLDAVIRQRREVTPVPAWGQEQGLRTMREARLSEELLQIQSRISELQKSRGEMEARLEEAGSLKKLLFAQGPELESAILKAMRLMGFAASKYRDADSEFDVVLICDDGRCIGEAEGREKRAIGIDKMRQLEFNILEDLERDEVSEPAKGILFGNAHRLTRPSERPDTHFTAKCVSAAKRSRTALIRTCRLFEVAKVLADEPNEEYAASCRKAILDASGVEVEFPDPGKVEGREKS